MTQTSQLDRIIAAGKLKLREATSLTEVAAAMASALPKVSSGELEFPPVAPKTEITEDAKKALLALPKVFGQVQPSARRVLTHEEIEQISAEVKVVKKIVELLGGREDAIKTTIKHHMDVAAEKAGKADPATSPRDKNGHYVLGAQGDPERLPIPGTNEDWSREYRAPKAALNFGGPELLRMYEDGEITRQQYLSMTRETRVFDETKALKAIQDDPALLAKLADRVSAGTPSSAMFLRRRKAQ